MTGIFASNYPISRSSGRCAATGKPFAAGDHLVAALIEAEGQEDLLRVDYSKEAWDSGARPMAPYHLFAAWKAAYQPPDAKRKLLLGDEELLDLFEQLAASDQPRQRAFRYVLALLLVRRKVLIYEGQIDGVMKVRERRTAAEPPASVVEVIDPGLDDKTTAEVIEQLGEVIGES